MQTGSQSWHRAAREPGYNWPPSQKAMGRHEDARKAGMKALEVSPEFVPAYVRKLGESFLFDEPRDFAMAEKYMGKILELQPSEYRSHDLLGDVYRAQGDHDGGSRQVHTRDRARSRPRNGSLHQRGHVHSFLGNFNAARADYQAAMDLSDAAEVTEFGIGKALVAIYEGNPQRAISELEALVVARRHDRISPSHGAPSSGYFPRLWPSRPTTASRIPPGIAIQMSESILKEQAAEVGSEEFRRRNEARLAYFEGWLAARLGNYEVASWRAQGIMDLLEADTNPRKNELAHEILGMVNLLQGNYEEAIEHYQLIAKGYVYARYHLALARPRRGRPRESRARNVQRSRKLQLQRHGLLFDSRGRPDQGVRKVATCRDDGH